ncbi:MAG: hypothetical protein IK016_04175, partial [Lachnospiraceae bacterium]|nr:hypothetical protein [Lachnospiraceae bacterium]
MKNGKQKETKQVVRKAVRKEPKRKASEHPRLQRTRFLALALVAAMLASIMGVDTSMIRALAAEEQTEVQEQVQTETQELNESTETVTTTATPEVQQEQQQE